MRLFIAVKFSEEMTGAVLKMQSQLRRAGVGGNYTKRENLHLTLAFIGEYDDPDKVLEVISSVPLPKLELTLDGFGSFDGIWWAGITRDPRLEDYVRRLRHALSLAGIPFDGKRFSPHITLIRKPDRAPMPALNVPEAAPSPVRVSLMRSDRGKYGVIYTEIT